MAEPPIRRYPRTLRRSIPVQVTIEETRRRRPLLRIVSLPALLVLGFAAAILIGAFLLMLPISSQSRDWTSPVVALFVSTSAVCVTGLVPVDTGTYWSGFGQGVILVLIQFGGLGFMTSATLLFLLFGWRVGMRERLFLSESLDLSRMGGVVRLTRRAIIFTLVAEGIGFLILFARFATEVSLDKALWWGLFHSVSAFNNAGFDVFGHFRSLEGHDDFITLVTIGTLVIIGGIGYLVVEAVIQGRRSSMSLDAKVVLTTTAGLLILGMVVFYFLESGTTLAGRSLPDQLLQSWFHSVTPRTAGFNSLPLRSMNEETLFFNLGLMFVGGGSGSTAGGIKVGTLAVILATAYSTIRGRPNPEIARREIRRSDVDRALTVTLLSALLIFFVSLVLTRLEPWDFLSLIFEVTSAFGTVGLSNGLTPNLDDWGLLVITATMFVGRLGTLTLVLALVQRSQRQHLRWPEERVRIG